MPPKPLLPLLYPKPSTTILHLSNSVDTLMIYLLNANDSVETTDANGFTTVSSIEQTSGFLKTCCRLINTLESILRHGLLPTQPDNTLVEELIALCEDKQDAAEAVAYLETLQR